MSKAVLFLRAQTSLHPGAAASTGAIDLPIQRERHTDWPLIQSSSIKGVLRDAYRMHLVRLSADDPKKCADRAEADRSLDVTEMFGPPVGEVLEHAGALAVTDARLLAFPVRSARGGYALVTCPGVIERMERDLALVGQSIPDTSPPSQTILPALDEAICASNAGGLLLRASQANRPAGDQIILEDLLFTVHRPPTDPATATPRRSQTDRLARWLAGKGAGDAGERLVVIHDDAFTHLVKYGTELVTRIGLDYDTKHVRTGALFLQEFLPPETILYVLLLAEDTRKSGSSRTGTRIIQDIEAVVNGARLLQIGGDVTTGKGWCWARI
jgi:CRISPR-associated protein Cmr4